MLKTLLASPDELFQKSASQIIAFCGKGQLKDDSAAASEFRAVLASAPPAVLEHFADECLNEGFKDSGLALQDIMNELAKRLGFRVGFGRYRGRKGDHAPDGIWVAPGSEFALV